MSAATSSALCPELPNVVKLSSLVTRVMGMNPGPFTLTGSCTYLVGSGPKKTLIDTAGGVPKYVDLLLEALAVDNAKDGAGGGVAPYIERVLLTHNHEDHIGGIEQILSSASLAGRRQVPIYKLPSASRPNSGGDAILREMIQKGNATAVASGQGETSAAQSSGGGGDFIPLKSGDVFEAGPGCTLSVQVTPGHCEDHVVFHLKEERAIFTGDTVLGHGSTVFMSYPDFMTSLTAMVATQPIKLYPGHGPVVEDGMGKIQEYIDHRNKREVQIYECLARYHEEETAKRMAAGGTSSESAGPIQLTALEIVERVYLETPAHLHFAAAMNVSHHCKKLWREGKVEPSFPTLATAEGKETTASNHLKDMLEENEYLMDKGKETTPERGRVEQLIGIHWKLTPPVTGTPTSDEGGAKL